MAVKIMIPCMGYSLGVSIISMVSGVIELLFAIIFCSWERIAEMVINVITIMMFKTIVMFVYSRSMFFRNFFVPICSIQIPNISANENDSNVEYEPI